MLLYPARREVNGSSIKVKKKVLYFFPKHFQYLILLSS